MELKDLFELTSQYGSDISEWPTEALTSMIDMIELELEERVETATTRQQNQSDTAHIDTSEYPQIAPEESLEYADEQAYLLHALRH